MTQPPPLPLPAELIARIYQMDTTYHEVFEVVLDEIRLRASLQRAREEFLMQQELDLNIFELNAHLYIADLTGGDMFA